MQHSQFNFVWQGTNGLAVIMLLIAFAPAYAAKPDPLLDSGPTVPCAAGMDYSEGTDVNGNPVVPADIGAQPVPVPGTVMVPLPGNARGRGRNSAYAALDGRKLDPLVNPPPCH